MRRISLSSRIKKLELRMKPPKKIYTIFNWHGENLDKAKQEYCQKHNISMNDLNTGIILVITLGTEGKPEKTIWE